MLLYTAVSQPVGSIKRTVMRVKHKQTNFSYLYCDYFCNTVDICITSAAMQLTFRTLWLQRWHQCAWKLAQTIASPYRIDRRTHLCQVGITWTFSVGWVSKRVSKRRGNSSDNCLLRCMYTVCQVSRKWVLLIFLFINMSKTPLRMFQWIITTHCWVISQQWMNIRYWVMRVKYSRMFVMNRESNCSETVNKWITQGIISRLVNSSSHHSRRLSARLVMFEITATRGVSFQKTSYITGYKVNSELYINQ